MSSSISNIIPCMLCASPYRVILDHELEQVVERKPDSRQGQIGNPICRFGYGGTRRAERASECLLLDLAHFK